MTRVGEFSAATGTRRHYSGGMTLVELMVSLIIGLGVTLAITSLLIASENHKRTSTSSNDAEQTGAFSFHALDGVLRGAGSAFAESAFPSDRGALACRLNVTTILPRAGAFPVPFNSAALTAVGANLRLAPLVIAQNQSPDGLSDVLIVMGGSGAAGGVSRQITGSGGSSSLILDNSVGFNPQDLALVSQNGTQDCMLEEVSTIATNTLNLGGVYYSLGGSLLSTLSNSTSSYVTPLGNATANNLQFELIGVGADRTLYSYDLLQNLNLVALSGTDVAQAMADGVEQLHAIYAVDNNADGVPDAWASPGDAGYDYTTVMTTATTQRQIIGVRVALVLRGEYFDKNLAAAQASLTPAQMTLTIFGGLTNLGGTSLAQTITTQAGYRYRVFEFTVPLRNMLLLAGA
jgi:type IV pilus assembly protein PilW